MLAALAAFASCQNYDWEAYKPDTTFRRNGTVSLLATFENLSTKVSMDDGGHGLWDAGDELAVFLTDGSFVSFPLDGTGETRRAVFTGNIPSGKTLGSVAVWPASAVVSLDGNQLTLQLPKALTGASYPGILVGAIGDTWEVNFKQALSFLRLAMNNFPVEAEKVVFEADAPLCGQFTASVSSILSGGLKCADGVGENSLTLTVTSPDQTVYALLPLPSDRYASLRVNMYDNAEKLVLSQPLSDYAISLERAELRRMAVALNDVEAPPCRIHLGSQRIEMAASSEGVYEGIFDVPAETAFTIEFDGVPYGFTTRSGAGGLGTISSGNSALPAEKARLNKSKRTYYVKRALGSLSPLENQGNTFTVNLESPGQLHVVADRSVANSPKYRINLVETPDPKVLFHEDFDLCTQGGDYLAPAAGCILTAAEADGWKPGRAQSSANVPSFPFDWPVKVAATLCQESYVQTYGLQDWTFVQAGERPGGMQLCAGTLKGSMLTPALTAVGAGTTDAVLTLDLARFSTTSTSDIGIVLQGGGTFVSGSVIRDAYTSAKEGTTYPEATTGYTAFEEEGTRFSIQDDTYCPHSADNNDVDKPVSHYTFQLTGVTAATRIYIDATQPNASGNYPRMFLFDIKVTKK